MLENTTDFQYLGPLFVLAFHTLIVTMILGYRRIKNGAEYPENYFKTYNVGDREKYPRLAEQASRNYINLFELPVLFYVNVLVTLYLGHQNMVFIALWWCFVFSRVIHSYVHLWSNKVPQRFLAFVFGACVLLGTWFYLLFKELTMQTLLPY